MVTELFMRLVNAEEKGLVASISTVMAVALSRREGRSELVIEPAARLPSNQSSEARSTLKPAASSCATTSSIACGVLGLAFDLDHRVLGRQPA